MSVSLNEKPIVSLPASLNQLTHDRFADEVRQAIASSPPSVVLDCSQLLRVTSSHVNYLWQAYDLCSRAKIPLVIQNASPNLWRVLKLLDLAEFFERDDNDFQPTQKIEFTATEEGISSALASFADYLKRLAVPTMPDFELRTLFYEVATNIRFHGRLQPEQTIKFRAETADNRIEMVFTDSGRQFDPTTVPIEPNLRDAARQGQKRGFGLTMIRRLADVVTFRRVDDSINELTVTKRWSM